MSTLRTPPATTSGSVTAIPLDPSQSVFVFESNVREALRLRVDQSVIEKQLGSKLADCREKYEDEYRKRDGVRIRDFHPLDYVEFTAWKKLVKENWEAVKPVFDDLARMNTYLSIMADFRNNPAHSREVVGHEPLLMAGIALHVRNQVAVYRQNAGGSGRPYARIESVSDSLGRTVDLNEDTALSPPALVEVGDTVEFDVRAQDPRERPLFWMISPHRRFENFPTLDRVDGSEAHLSYTFVRDDIGDGFSLMIYVGHDGNYPRHRRTYSVEGRGEDDPVEEYDHQVWVNFNVDPHPDDII